MTPQNFVTQLHIAVVEENVSIYRDLFVNTPIDAASDPYWESALSLFGTLSPEQRQIFFDIVRQVTIDTTSNVLGVIDGINTLENDSGEFDFICNGKKLNGDLQSLFLVEEEKRLGSTAHDQNAGP